MFRISSVMFSTFSSVDVVEKRCFVSLLKVLFWAVFPHRIWSAALRIQSVLCPVQICKFVTRIFNILYWKTQLGYSRLWHLAVHSSGFPWVLKILENVWICGEKNIHKYCRNWSLEVLEFRYFSSAVQCSRNKIATQMFLKIIDEKLGRLTQKFCS